MGWQPVSLYIHTGAGGAVVISDVDQLASNHIQHHRTADSWMRCLGYRISNSSISTAADNTMYMGCYTTFAFAGKYLSVFYTRLQNEYNTVVQYVLMY